MENQSPLILVADDQAGVRRLLQELFTAAGFRVAQAANGQAAVAMAMAEEPRIALLDVKMPVMDGLEALRALRSMYPRLPVIMMTAVGDQDRVLEALTAGALQTITKPFDVFVLVDQVRDAMSRNRNV